nr:hypothetical protein [Tanacetum cinerariifolium]
IILDTYGDTVTLKRRRDDADKDEEPSARSNRGSKRRREGKEQELTSAPKEKATKTTGKSTQGSKSYQKTQYPHNLLKPLPLIPNSRGLHVIPFDHFIKNDLEYLRSGTSSHLQLGVKSYQKKLNLTKPDTYRFDLKRKKAYVAYSNPRGFIYQNKDKQNSLMRIKELHKFSNGTLNDVRTALDDRLKAKDEKDHVKSREVYWWKIVQGRLQDATMDRMMSLSYK